MGTDPEFIPLRRRSGATLLNFDLLKWANFSTISAFSYLSSSKRMPYGNLPGLFFTASFTRFVSIPYVDMSSMHVLCMASIYYCDGVANYRVGEVPLVGIGHVVACPLGDGRLSTKEGALYLKHRIDSIINVLVHQFLRVRMLVLLRDVAVESVYLRQTPFLDDIPHGSAYTSRIVW